LLRPRAKPTIESAFRAVQSIHALFLFSIFLVLRAVEKVGQREQRDVHTIWLAFIVLALANIATNIFLRSKILKPAVEILRAQPDDRIGLARWRHANFALSSLSVSVMYFGFALKFLGGSPLQSFPFYLGAVVLMVIWWPRRP